MFSAEVLHSEMFYVGTKEQGRLTLSYVILKDFCIVLWSQSGTVSFLHALQVLHFARQPSLHMLGATVEASLAFVCDTSNGAEYFALYHPKMPNTH